MSYNAATSALVPFLQAEGLLPDECGPVTVNFPLDGPLTITYTVFVDGERLKKFQRAFNAYMNSLEKPEASPTVGYDGPIEVGMRFIWEKDKPHAYVEIEVIQIDRPNSGQCAIWVKRLDGRPGQYWNEEGRFREAVTPL